MIGFDNIIQVSDPPMHGVRQMLSFRFYLVIAAP